MEVDSGDEEAATVARSRKRSIDDAGQEDLQRVAALQERHAEALSRERELRREMAQLQERAAQLSLERQQMEQELDDALAQRNALEPRQVLPETVAQPADDGKTEEERAAERREKVAEARRLVKEALGQQIADVKAGNVPPRDVPLRFLGAGEELAFPAKRVALASYPRSGNSLLRSFLESLTGIYTGSDSDPRRPLNKQLVEAGMKGEGIVEDLVFAVKTHFPERLGHCPVLAARCVLLVRNPVDAIVSYFNMVLTETHTDSIEDDEFVKYAEMWDAFVREEVEVWKAFYNHWLSKTVTSAVDVLVVRFEDMVQHPRVTFGRVARFVLGLESLEGTPYEDQLEAFLRVSGAARGIYTPRSGAACEPSAAPEKVAPPVGAEAPKPAVAPAGERNVGPLLPLPAKALKNEHVFPDGLLRTVVRSAKSELCTFGYWDSFFASRFGEAKAARPVDECILLRSGKPKQGSGKPKQGSGKPSVLLNARYPLRPSTNDDPFARGFGRRWRAELQRLPPTRIKGRAAPRNHVS